MNGSDPDPVPVAAPVSAPASAPLIGLTTYLEQATTGVWDVSAAFLPEVYFDAVIRAGGIAVLLPPQPANPETVGRVLDSLDGLIVTGGRTSIPPGTARRRIRSPTRRAGTGTPGRTSLLRAAIERDLPFLGICRGAQLLNVSLGGTLHQHLPDLLGHAGHQAGGGVFGVVDVVVEPDSRLHDLLEAPQSTLTVPVYHHQSIDRLGAGLSVTAVTREGVVQAVELAGVGFGVAVQWHPEQDPDDLRLFAGLVDAARGYRSARDSRAAGAAVTAPAPASARAPEHEHEHEHERRISE
ncbi:gamma-glutamyl-gamma-aminobutyrate hydrolase family protein [Cryobacterium breve]|uniref:gamma-glutamyl-gamma-aminobutyrate hydrolase family protein n=1 Tax=Cryobacterium breve TaxID=1259258 RepID=UPI00248C84AA|nr:gamma-glutamyl-gamma-aminobutyrate hydrolase family protein [Cryobacterium breve]